ncbi:hypothetical protein [Selenomonas ruminantium]|uniref:hypothetical protein n=1 Tax=Selenomonas ruminantium TaxID=971 RepID=UPI0026F15081|nr:hypothetical protein [Selenomonas ruminantium]
MKNRESKMLEIAKLMGKEPNKPFEIQQTGMFGVVINKVVINEKGFYYQGKTYTKNQKPKWIHSPELLYEWILGIAKEKE